MRLRELISWPPAKAGGVPHSDPSPFPPDGMYESSVFVSANPPNPSYLALMIKVETGSHVAVIRGQEEATLRRIQAALKAQEGQTIAELADLEVCGAS